MRFGIRHSRFFPALGLAVIGASATLADGPAVSGLNGRLSVEGGGFDGDDAFVALGSVTLPVGSVLGLQFDAATGRIDDEALWGGAAHLFTRDPERYLLGVYTSYHEWYDIRIWRIAAEAEVYVDRLSLEGIVGLENTDVPEFVHGLQILTDDSEQVFIDADLAYYPLDDLKLYGGYRFIGETSLAAAGAEYLLRQLGTPISLFVESRFGDDDHDRITGGVRAYFGADSTKSLIQRHRTEDPDNYLPTFPTLVTAQPPQSTPPPKLPPEPKPPRCEVVEGTVVGPGNAAATGDCVCPSGTALSGGPPISAGGSFSCDGQ